MNVFNSCVSSIFICACSSSEKYRLMSTRFAPNTSLLLSKGEWRASSIALVRRFSPEPKPVLIMATPPSLSVVLTSAKSRFTWLLVVMISAMLLAAVVSVSSALAKAFMKFKSGYISLNLSLLMTRRASTYCRISSTPANAFLILGSPSKRNGIVTIPTVSTPSPFAMRATTGAAPVPVPPPIPAVMNTILVPSLNSFEISSSLSSAAARAISGLLPAPNPWVMDFPSCTFRGIGDLVSA